MEIAKHLLISHIIKSDCLLLGDAYEITDMSMFKIEPNSCKKSLIDGTSDREACHKYWTAVLVQMCTEQKVGAKLDKLGIINYVPTQTEIHQWSDRKKKVERIVIPMVVFVLVDKETEKNLRTFSFIYKFISYPGQKEAAIIPNEQIEKLKFMLNNADSNVEVSDSAYEVGEEVEIVRGPLKGFYGELCYFEKGKPKVGIYIELLGYACVSVNINDVKRKNK